MLEELQAKYIKTNTGGCKTSGVSSSSTAVSFHQVAGLWILLGAGIGVAFLLAAAHQVLRRGARRVAKTELYARSAKRVGSSVRSVHSGVSKSLKRAGTLVRMGSGASSGRGGPAGSSAGSDDGEQGKGDGAAAAPGGSRA